MFIYKDYIDKTICKNLIKLHDKCNKKIKIDDKHRTYTQTLWHPESIEMTGYTIELSKILNKYKLKYVYIDKNQNPWGTEGTIKIQKYEPGENYFDWHAENTGYDQNEKRILVFTTYLNDVYNGGETEFYYYKEKVKPKEGLTVLFPPFWTHAHRGAMTKEIKYIITGWYRYVH
tara:strand:+ start:63 stop:584 length:522 start_codon:yes stop_codon:yes gene_type:complete